MKIKTSLFLTALIIFICCMGVASAAEDISDDTISTDSDLGELEQTDDATLEVNNEEEVLSTVISQNVSTWADLKSYSQSTAADYEITVANGTYNVGSDSITFGNNAKIIGSGNTVITGGNSSVIPFQGTGKSITFSNLIFRNMNSDMVIKLVDSGSSKIENCVFENILTGTSGQKSVVYNNGGYMQVINTNFTNCNTTFGVITNHKTATTTFMDVENCKFEYNNANSEPGAINNCGIMNITACVFNYNHAGLWAGAVHTHTNAKSVIKRSSFTGNTAGYNGGALYTYADLEVYDSNFTNNNCTTNAGGGAIGASNYFFASKAYNVTINNCRFVDNNNLNSAGYGGAITGMNGGTLFVNGSTFIHNSAKIGQAIAAYNTKQYANISEGQAHLVITNNQFINHTVYTSTTVFLSGNYIFVNNTFINSPQTVYSGNGNTYNSASSSSKKFNGLLGANYDEELADVEYIGSNNDFNNKLQELWWTGGEIYLSDGTFSCNLNGLDYLGENIFIIGKSKDNTKINSIVLTRSYQEFLDMGMVIMTVENGGGSLIWVNVTFDAPISLSATNQKFINCTFNSSIVLEEMLSSFDAEEFASQEIQFNLFDYVFENCSFINYDDTVITGYKNANINISNCYFENIKADNIITFNEGKGLNLDFTTNPSTPIYVQAEVNLKNSVFKNSNIKSIVKAKNGVVDYITIENNQYEFVKYQTTSDGDYTYIDVPVVVDSKITIANESDVVIITVTADGKAVSGATVNYTIGDDKKSNVTDVNGQIKISGLTDAFEIVANYFGNSYINSNSSSEKFNFTKSTSTDNTNSSTNGTSTNTGNTNTNQQTKKITKKATKITAKKATFKAKKKTKKYTIVLKASKKAVKKVKVTLKVGKKTYKATTNSKGKATFKITKLNKKGKYTAVIKFKGNKNFKPTSKKVKITVKK